MTGASGRWPLRLLLLLLCVLVNGEIPASSGPHRRPLSPEAPAQGPPAQQSRRADERIVHAVEARLLDVFGLSSRPRPSGSAPIPAYMKELYQSHLQASRTRPQRKEHFRAHGRGPVQANTVRSFFHRDLTPSPDCPERSCITLWFNVSLLPSTESVTAAELRIFKDLPQLRQASAAGSGRPHSTRVEVHEVMRPAGRDSDSIARLLDTRQLALSGEPWESFDVHPAVLKWQRTPHLNHGLEVRVLSDSPAVSTDAHVRLRRSTGDDGPLAKWQSERPLLVTYTDDGKGANSRVKRSSSSSSSGREDGAAGEKTKKGRRKRENTRRERRRRRRGRRNRKKKNRKKGDRRRRKQKNECRRHALYVDFSDVGWNDWIVAPAGYNAYYCSGECNFPLQDHANTTNHAIVQTLVNSVDPSAVPKACCVPTELSAISMLYLDEYEMVVLKNYQDMVVEACGCR